MGAPLAAAGFRASNVEPGEGGSIRGGRISRIERRVLATGGISRNCGAARDDGALMTSPAPELEPHLGGSARHSTREIRNAREGSPSDDEATRDSARELEPHLGGSARHSTREIRNAREGSPSAVRGPAAPLPIATLAAWVDEVEREGGVTVDTTAAVAFGVAHGARPPAVRRCLGDLVRVGRLVGLIRGTFAIAPIATPFRVSAVAWVPVIAARLRTPYYFGVDTAVAIHVGAALPEAICVVVRRRRHMIAAGSAVELVGSAHVGRVPVETLQVEGRLARVSTVEATALDLMGYHYTDNLVVETPEEGVAILAPLLDEDRLVEAASSMPVAWAQRLGWTLDRLGHRALTRALEDWVWSRAAGYARLDPSSDAPIGSTSTRWKLWIDDVASGDDA